MMAPTDILFLGIYFLAVLAIGWRLRRTGATASQHYLAEHTMGTVTIGLSIMATTFSAINFIAIPEEIATHGLYVILSFPVFFLAAWPISRIWMPYFHRMQATTVYEFLECRFSRRIRLLSSMLFLFWRFLWMAVALYVSGRILAVFTGMNPLLLLAICGGIVTLYTCLGGIKAVMWTDVLQFLVVLSCILLAVFTAIRAVPGGFWATLKNGERLMPYLPPDPHYLSPDFQNRMSIWSVLLGTFTAFLARYGADQMVMQRYFSAKSLQKAQQGIWLNAGASCVALLLLTLLGLSLYVLSPRTAQANSGFAMKQLLAIAQRLPAGGKGILLAGLLAATMSSVDSGINACSAALSIDFRVKISARVLTVVCGILITLLAMFLLPPLHRQQSIFAIVNRFVNSIGSPLLLLILLGMSPWEIAERRLFWGSLLGILACLVATAMIPRLSLHYYAVMNLLIMALCCLPALRRKRTPENSPKQNFP